MISQLTKLKNDRDVCYTYACAAYGKAFVDAQLYEPNEDDLDVRNSIMDIRRLLVPIDKDQYEYGSIALDFHTIE